MTSPSEHFADRLTAACRAKGTPICVGLDPVHDRLPASLKKLRDPLAGIEEFCRGVLRVVAPLVPCVKPQSACFERYGPPGVEVYRRITQEARRLGLIVVGDAKRGDIGITAEHYAAGCLADQGDALGPDSLTINAYLGRDGIEPFATVARAQGKGLFALVRTSNPGGDALQALKLADGRSVAEAVADMIADLGSKDVGKSGYSLLGAVVGATKATEAAELRRRMPQQIFLVPGFGAQGGKADDVKACFDASGGGAIITASRSILYAYEKPETDDWTGAIERATVRMRGEIEQILS